MSESPYAVRVVAPSLLVLGVAVTTLLFARGQGWLDGDAVEGAGESAAPVHATAGEGATVTSGDVAALFRQRVEVLQQRLDEAPEDRDAILQLARLFHDGHRAHEAASLYRKAISMNPDDAQPYFDLASVLAEDGEWDSAAEALDGLLVRRPGDAVALYNLGAVRANQGRFEEAKGHLLAAQAAGDSALLPRITDALLRLQAR